MSDPSANYHGGAATSIEAGRAAAESRLDRMQKVEMVLRLADDRGMTGEELEGATGISHQSIGGIILKLIEEKRIHRPGGSRTRKTRSGSDAWICFIGPGENVGRVPRSDKEVTYVELLQRFTDALHRGRLSGPGAAAAAKALRDAGFRRAP